MSITFNNDVNDETVATIRKLFGEPVAHDRRTFLINEAFEQIEQKKMKEVANAAKQPATLEINGQDEIKELSDGTRYHVTPQGWRKIED